MHRELDVDGWMEINRDVIGSTAQSTQRERERRVERGAKKDPSTMREKEEEEEESIL